MKDTDYQEALQKWRAWIKNVETTLSGLVLDDYVFRQSMQIAKQDGAINSGNEIYKWAMRIYGTHASIAIRRALDSNESTHSLVALIKKIKNNPQVITRQDFVSRYPEKMRRAADSVFDRIAGPGADVLPESVPERDLSTLQVLWDRIRTVVDKVIAHRERNPGDIPAVRWMALHDAIAQLEKMCIRYCLLLNQEDPETLLPSISAGDAERDARIVWGHRIDDNRDGFLVEYQAAQASAEHAHSMAWTITSVSWGASLILLGLIANSFARAPRPFLSLLGVIGILFTAGEWYKSKALERIKGQKYARCCELEKMLGLSQHSNLKYSATPHKQIFLFITILLLVAWVAVVVLPWIR